MIHLPMADCARLSLRGFQGLAARSRSGLRREACERPERLRVRHGGEVRRAPREDQKWSF